MDMMTTKLSQIEPINKCMNVCNRVYDILFCHVSVATMKQKLFPPEKSLFYL